MPRDHSPLYLLFPLLLLSLLPHLFQAQVLQSLQLLPLLAPLANHLVRQVFGPVKVHLQTGNRCIHHCQSMMIMRNMQPHTALTAYASVTCSHTTTASITDSQ